MLIREKYKQELNSLLENEKNVGFFCRLIKDKFYVSIQEAVDIAAVVCEFADKNKLYITKGWMKYYMGLYFYDTSKYDHAITSLYESLEEFSKTYDKYALAHVYNGLSFVFSKNGQHILANDYGLMGISYAKCLDDTTILKTTLLNIAVNSINSGSLSSAKSIIDYLEETYADSLTIRENIVCSLYKANIELSLDNFVEAEKYLAKVEEYFDCKEFKEFDIEYNILKGKLSFKLDKISDVVKYMENALSISRNTKRTRFESEALLEYGKILISMDRKKEGIEKIKLAVGLAEELNLNKILIDGYMILYSYYKENYDHVSSLGYLEKHMLVVERVNNYRNSKLIKKLDVDIKDNEINLYKLLHDKTEVLSSMGEKITSTLNLDELFMVIKNEINKLMKVDFIGITTLNQDDESVTFRTYDEHGYKISIVDELDKDKHFSAHSIYDQKIVVINNMVKEHKKYVKSFDARNRGKTRGLSAVYLPLIVRDKVIGCMVVEAINENNFNNSDVNVLKVLGNYVAIAIINAIEYKKIEDIAIYDGMTGFLNKKEIIKEGEKLQKEFVNRGTHYSILMIDMDDFKSVNDLHGHVIGDKTIGVVTKSICKQVRSTDLAGRYGGDEFLLICPNLYSADAYKLAERIRTAVEDSKFINNGRYVCPTVSIGVCQSTSEDESFSDVIKRADSYLYKAKNQMKNAVVVG